MRIGDWFAAAGRHFGIRYLCLSLLAGLVLPAPARAASFFHGEPRQIRACVLLVPSTAPVLTGLSTPASVFAPLGQNLNPYVFYAMDQRTDLRPQSWEFVNP